MIELTEQEVEAVRGLVRKGCARAEVEDVFGLLAGELDAIVADEIRGGE